MYEGIYIGLTNTPLGSPCCPVKKHLISEVYEQT